MSAITSFFVVDARCFGLRRSFTAALLLLLILLPAAMTQAQDGVLEMRDAAKFWAMHRIAVIQAAAGDVQGAKQTASQIGEDCDQGPSEVTVVWTCNGQLLYDHPPGSASWSRGGWQGFYNRDGAVDQISSAVPAGLPSDYLAANPRHGAVVDFTDEDDSHGTRITSRRYADGHVVIETPHAGRQAK